MSLLLITLYDIVQVDASDSIDRCRWPMAPDIDCLYGDFVAVTSVCHLCFSAKCRPNIKCQLYSLFFRSAFELMPLHPRRLPIDVVVSMDWLPQAPLRTTPLASARLQLSRPLPQRHCINLAFASDRSCIYSTPRTNIIAVSPRTGRAGCPCVCSL